MKVMIIPEDPFLDQYILKPVVECIFNDLQTKAKIVVLQGPRLRGVAQALNKEMVNRIIAENPMEDLFLLIVDRDCNRDTNEKQAQDRQKEHSEKLIACLAVQEVEVWMLALHRKELKLKWGDVQKECDPKEHFAEPFLKEQGWWNTVGKGRKNAMKDLNSHWPGVLKCCPELKGLKKNIANWLQQRK